MPNLMIAAGIFHPETGGPATYLKDILPALQNHGWHPSVLTYGDDAVHRYPYPVKRIARQTLPMRLTKYHLASYPLVTASDLIYAHTIDLPVAWGRTPRLIKIVGDQAWERCIRRGWIAPTRDIDAFQQERDSWLAQRQKKSRARQVRAFDGVIVPSHYLKQMVQGWGVPEDHIHVVYNAMPPEKDDLPSTQAAARQALGWQPTPTLLTAARLTPWKGVDHLINALKQCENVHLVVAGEGSELPRLRELARPLAERVRFVGRVPREQLYLMMKAADYFVLYSGYEGLPHTLLEALRVGTPVIASDKGGNPEVVQQGINGFLVPYVDVDALAQTIQTAFINSQRKQRAAQVHVGLDRFTFQRMVTETDKILRQYL